VAIHDEGVREKCGDSKELGNAVLSDIRRQDWWYGEHDKTRSGIGSADIFGHKQRGSLSIKGWTELDMRSRGTPSRLEIHRLTYNQAGRRGALLTLRDLDDYEKEQLNREILQDVRVKRLDFTGDMDEDVFDQVQAEVFSEWGVMCPHHNTDLIGDHLKFMCKCRACGALMSSIVKGYITNSGKSFKGKFISE